METLQTVITHMAIGFTIAAAIFGISAMWMPKPFRRFLGETGLKLLATSIILDVCAIILAVLVK